MPSTSKKFPVTTSAVARKASPREAAVTGNSARATKPEKTRFLARSSRYIGYEKTLFELSARAHPTLNGSDSRKTSDSGDFTGTDRKTTWYSSEKMAVFAPI